MQWVMLCWGAGTEKLRSLMAECNEASSTHVPHGRCWIPGSCWSSQSQSCLTQCALSADTSKEGPTVPLCCQGCMAVAAAGVMAERGHVHRTDVQPFPFTSFHTTNTNTATVQLHLQSKGIQAVPMRVRLQTASCTTHKSVACIHAFTLHDTHILDRRPMIGDERQRHRPHHPVDSRLKIVLHKDVKGHQNQKLKMWEPCMQSSEQVPQHHRRCANDGALVYEAELQSSYHIPLLTLLY